MRLARNGATTARQADRVAGGGRAANSWGWRLGWQWLKRLLFAGLLFAGLLPSGMPSRHSVWAADEARRESLERIESLELPSIDEAASPVVCRWDSEEAPAVTVICFVGTECPLARLYASRLEQLHQQFTARDVWFLGVSSNQQDSPEELREFVSEHEIAFAVAKDYDNRLADKLGATRTPEVFVIDQRGQVRYRGRIDDQYLPGLARSEPTQHDLRRALETLLAGQEIEVVRTEVVGCLIGRVVTADEQSDVTYADQIARVLQRNCIECHREGEIGPFALTDYDEVVGWGEMILEVIETGRMPPWHANPEVGRFANERIMPQEDKRLLARWVEAGMPSGDPQFLPEVPPKPTGWQLPREPDMVLEMRAAPLSIPAEGVIEYQYFVVDPQFTEDKWIAAAEVQPGNRSVVHHSIVFIRPPDGSRFRGIGWLSAYVPGQRRVELPQGMARRVPAGSKLVFQMHYTPNGKPQEDLTRIGLLLSDPDQVDHEVVTLVAINQEFEIPPRAARHAVEAQLTNLPARATLLSATPHMHLRGRSFQLFGVRDDQRVPLLDVPRYDFNWQHSYEFQQPLQLEDWQRLEFKAMFDNSADNPVNPDPSVYVNWGDQTWEEMAIAFFDVAEPLAEVEPPAVAADDASSELIVDDDLIQRRQAFVEDFLARIDSNRDGQVHFEEAPIVVQRFTFRVFDLNDDRVITAEELREYADARVQ